ncbi:hypothetical protein BCR34DRAFT_656464, partial [Clohesyomyces aquaticus]
DTATVLEFLAWGRKKNVDFAHDPQHVSGPRRPEIADYSPEDGAPGAATNYLTESSKTVQLDMLEALLPAKQHIRQLVEYHNDSLLWYHGSYSAKIFSADLDTFFLDFGGNIRHEQLNIQWLALLFAILAGSMTCASPSTCRAWGFTTTEQTTLSLRWYEATITSLTMADFIELHTVYSVQAIATLTISAHILGKSNSQSVLLASAGRIAQSLGLHRLGTPATSVATDQLRKREAGKRVFVQLCTQDWFQIPFSDSYSLSSSFSNTVKPMNCNDNDMIEHPDSTPTQASYCNYRYQIAALMPRLLDAMAECNTLYTKYEQVLKYDELMRKLATAYIPTFLSTNGPVAAEWPTYVSWGRRSLTICAAHKIIMIHRKFVGMSFTNTAFSFTRRTCLAASKTILKEALAGRDENGPVIWIEQAFAIAAGIILSLDALHRDSSDKEFEEHERLVANTVEYLRKFQHSKIAVRGVQLLSSLLRELRPSGLSNSRKRARAPRDNSALSTEKRTRTLDAETFIRDVAQNLGVTPPTSTPHAPAHIAADYNWDAFIDLIPPHTGFDGQFLFDDFFST